MVNFVPYFCIEFSRNMDHHVFLVTEQRMGYFAEATKG
jgi:hypothetical protein